MYESFFKTIELSMQPAIGMAEINRLAMERIAGQQTECMSDCIKTGMEQWFACADLDDPTSLADVQFKYLKLYEQQLSATAESNVQTLAHASDALQKIMGASMEQLLETNPFMALMADVGGSSSADPFFDWFKQSIVASQSVADTVTQGVAMPAAAPAAAKPAAAANSSAKVASRASAPGKSLTTSTASGRAASKKTTTHTAAKRTSPKSTATKSSTAKTSATKTSTEKASTGGSSAHPKAAAGSTASTATATAKDEPAKSAAASAKNTTGDTKNS